MSHFVCVHAHIYIKEQCIDRHRSGFEVCIIYPSKTSMCFVFLHPFVFPCLLLLPFSCNPRIHLTHVRVNMSWITKHLGHFLVHWVIMEQIILPLKNFFRKMGPYNSIVAVLYWKQLSWESSPSLSLTFSHSPLPLQSSSFTHLFNRLLSFPISFALFLSFPIIPFIID